VAFVLSRIFRDSIASPGRELGVPPAVVPKINFQIFPNLKRKRVGRGGVGTMLKFLAGM
jgi:hypothetical protein